MRFATIHRRRLICGLDIVRAEAERRPVDHNELHFKPSRLLEAA
jgi:hypothetical protein